MHNGILNNPNRNKQSFCFLRTTPGIENEVDAFHAMNKRDWIDVKGNQIDKDARNLLLQLKDSKLPSSGLLDSRVYNFEVYYIIISFI